MENKRYKTVVAFVAALALLASCKGEGAKVDGKSYVDADGNKVEKAAAVEEALPYSGDETGE